MSVDGIFFQGSLMAVLEDGCWTIYSPVWAISEEEDRTFNTQGMSNIGWFDMPGSRRVHVYGCANTLSVRGIPGTPLETALSGFEEIYRERN